MITSYCIIKLTVSHVYTNESVMVWKKKEYIKQACSHKVVSPVYSYNNRHIELSSLSIHIIIDI